MENLKRVVIESARVLLAPITEYFAQDIFLSFDSEITRYIDTCSCSNNRGY